MTSHQDVLEFYPNLAIDFLSKFGKQFLPKADIGWDNDSEVRIEELIVSVLCSLKQSCSAVYFGTWFLDIL